MAVLIAVAAGFYQVYKSVASKEESFSENSEEFQTFKGFLRNLLMHGAVGTASEELQLLLENLKIY